MVEKKRTTGNCESKGWHITSPAVIDFQIRSPRDQETNMLWSHHKESTTP